MQSPLALASYSEMIDKSDIIHKRDFGGCGAKRGKTEVVFQTN
jgi:hypothetical protein